MTSTRRPDQAVAALAAIGLLIFAACGGQPFSRGAPESSPLAAFSFEEASERTGLVFRHFTGATGEFYLPEIMGSGVALFDYDNDGDLDVYLVQGDFIDKGKSMRDASFPVADGWKGGGRLFRNELVPGGKLRFTDVTGGSGIAALFDGMGAAIGDFDNDGNLDLLVTGLGRCLLFSNSGNGKFVDVSKEMSIVDGHLSTSAAFVDYDRDGWLDLFVTHYVHGTTVERKKCRNTAAELDYCGPQAFPPSIDRLYHNEAGKRFRDVTAESGIGSSAGPGLGVLIADFNSDNWPDIYVANDGAGSFLWMNQKNGTFLESGLEMGVSYSSDGKAQAGMGVAVGDVDNDGREEILKTNLRREGANIYSKDAAGFYGDAAVRMNVLKPTFAHTGFGVGFADFDNDGWLDAFIANGAVMAMEQQRGQPYPFRQPNVLLHNVRGVFQQVEASPVFEQLIGRGAAFGDLDNDGAVDIVVANNNGPARLYLNKVPAQNPGRAHWLRVRLHSRNAGLRGFQAVVTVEMDSGKKQIRRVDPGGSYLSASDASAHFGLGTERRVKSLTVVWADGSRTAHSADAVDCEVQVNQP